ncbi:MAG TPA: hypothetical protein VH661_01295 [Candidatus Dormibacteraeota bacterium]|nr:hypothetical protein [Candidatus Dormibacteraeota bacterium]
MPSPTKLLLCCSVIALAGCGSAIASNGAGGAATPSASARAAAAGTAGQLVQVSGTKLTLSTTNGDVGVVYTGATVITTTSTGSPADIVTGTCVAIVGQKDSTGAVTATTVRLSRPVNGSCALGRPGGAGGSPRAFPSGGVRPSGAPALNPNTAVISGMVTAVTGTTVTVRTVAGATSSATVPTTLSVTESSAATSADLTVDSCVRAVGGKDAQGVVQATALTIQPANASGSCTFAGGGGFGFGGGRGFGGGGVPSPAA